jgi:protein disulfide-isomerase
MKFLYFILIACFCCANLSVKAQETKNGLTWYTDVNQVYELSTKSNKPIFAFFTGSDWCGWCHRLEAAVFDKPGFKEWANKNVILLMLDFPRNKQLPEALAKQNGELQSFFHVQGYPTIWLFTMNKDVTNNRFNITALGSLGYPDSKPGHEETAFIANADNILKNKK